MNNKFVKKEKLICLKTDKPSKNCIYLTSFFYQVMNPFISQLFGQQSNRRSQSHFYVDMNSCIHSKFYETFVQDILLLQ